MKNNKNIDAMQMHMNNNNLLQIYEFMLYVSVLIRHIIDLLFIQWITMFTQIITMFTFLLTFTT